MPDGNSISDMPTWKFVGVLFGIILAGAVIMTIFTAGMMALEDKYEQTPFIIVNAGYKNTTTIFVTFTDFWRVFDSNHFPATSAKVDHVDIRIDTNTTDIIRGEDLAQGPYYYTVDSSRHELVVEIYYMNGETNKESFSNAALGG